MSTHFYPGPSNIFNFSWIKCARSGLQVLENMYLFTKHQLYSQTSCFYLHVFEIIHDKNITATCLPTKLALKILIRMGRFCQTPKNKQSTPHQRAFFQVWRPADPALHDACPAWNGGRRCCWCFSSKVLIVFSKVGGWGLGHGVLVHIVKGGHRWWHCFYRCCWKKGRISWINIWISTGLVVEPKEIEVGVIHRNRLVKIWLIPIFVNIW